jgi:hypothetical protein
MKSVITNSIHPNSDLNACPHLPLSASSDIREKYKACVRYSLLFRNRHLFQSNKKVDFGKLIASAANVFNPHVSCHRQFVARVTLHYIQVGFISAWNAYILVACLAAR